MNLAELSTFCQTRLEKLFDYYLKDSLCPAKELQQAIAYAVFNGGKRIRPLLVYATGYALGAKWVNSDAPACAIELIHTYSLIHDDLPAMDNSDLRRGKPACHKAFTEALAILAGDALQPLAFEILASHPAELHAEQRLAMIKALSHASGQAGMVSGQALDLAGTDELTQMYQLKTGALLTASVKLGAIAADIKNPDILNALDQYAQNLGLAFQIQDDLLDFEHSATTGKPQGLDTTNNKVTLPTLIGIEQARKQIETLFADALTSLAVLDEKADILRELAHSLLQRKM